MLTGCGPSARTSRPEASRKRKDPIVSLVNALALTPARLPGNCSSARKSTGPRTAAGKRRGVLNALKHGRYSRAFRENLIKARANAELFDWIRARVSDCFKPLSERERWQAEQLAREVWSGPWRVRGAYWARRQGG